MYSYTRSISDPMKIIFTIANIKPKYTKKNLKLTSNKDPSKRKTERAREQRPTILLLTPGYGKIDLVCKYTRHSSVAESLTNGGLKLDLMFPKLLLIRFEGLPRISFT